jgi:hypothetical protein
METFPSLQVTPDQPLPSQGLSVRRSKWRRLAGCLGVQVMTIALPVVLLAATAQAGMYLGLGQQGDAVIELQQRLNQLGYRVTVDGQYGPETEQAVRALQRRRNLHVDGVVGEDTRIAIGLPSSETTVGFSTGSDLADSFTPGVTNSTASLGSKRYVVMIPTTDATTLSRVQWYFRSASAVRTPLGSYIQVRGYASRSEAESLSKYLRKEGFRDAHVRYF